MHTLYVIDRESRPVGRIEARVGLLTGPGPISRISAKSIWTRRADRSEWLFRRSDGPFPSVPQSYARWWAPSSGVRPSALPELLEEGSRRHPPQRSRKAGRSGGALADTAASRPSGQSRRAPSPPIGTSKALIQSSSNPMTERSAMPRTKPSSDIADVERLELIIKWEDDTAKADIVFD